MNKTADYGLEYHWDDGSLKWLQTVVDSSLRTDLDNLTIVQNELSGCDIKSKQSNDEMYVQRGAFKFYDFTISKITSVLNFPMFIIIKSQDKDPVQLNFISEAERTKGSYRIFLILNGNEIIKCNDDTNFICQNPSKMSVVFQ